MRAGRKWDEVSVSDSEKDAILGRAVREEKQLRSDLAAMDKQVSYITEALGEFKQEISRRVNPFHPDLTDLAIPSDLSAYADITRIVQLIRDRKALYEKLEEANRTLICLGVRESPVVIPGRS